METYTTAEGHIIHSYGNKELSKEQTERISQIMYRVWNALTDEKRTEINMQISNEERA